MEILPAIDIRQGRVVRLSQGRPDQETAYERDPLAAAERFLEQGARWLHVVDLDRAFGEGDNFAVISELIRRFGSRVRLEVSGGFRTADIARSVLALEVGRIVLGTLVIEQPELVPVLVGEAGPGRIAVGLDVKDGMVAIRGWAGTATQGAHEVARRVIGNGVGTLVYTDVRRDGMLSGPDLKGAVELQRLGAEVVLSGGVASLDDVKAARQAGLAGVIVGRAIYERRFSLPEALACAG